MSFEIFEHFKSKDLLECDGKKIYIDVFVKNSNGTAITAEHVDHLAAFFFSLVASQTIVKSSFRDLFNKLKNQNCDTALIGALVKQIRKAHKMTDKDLLILFIRV